MKIAVIVVALLVSACAPPGERVSVKAAVLEAIDPQGRSIVADDPMAEHYWIYTHR